jgi:glucose/arabinose dehydrogenase
VSALSSNRPGPACWHRGIQQREVGVRALIGAAVLTAGLLVAGVAATPAQAGVPAGFVRTTVVSGLSAPTAMAFTPNGRLFVTEQGGTVRVVSHGHLLSRPFLRLSVDSNGERGLLGIAFDPHFARNRFVYVYYTVPTAPIHNRVSRFTADGNVAVPGSQKPILDLDALSSATNHNGGAIHFGSDGKLYVAVGENANGANSQTLSNRLGKMLRINRDGSIPTDNPFYHQAQGANRAIWAMGLRNPFTFAFQRTTGRMFIDDVGQSAWEEINVGRAGANYGWQLCEGSSGCPAGTTLPYFAYPHSGPQPSGCAITGGTFYNPKHRSFPRRFVGDYFFSDLCSGWIYKIETTGARTVRRFATQLGSPVDLVVGPGGALNYLSHDGTLGRIQYTGG